MSTTSDQEMSECSRSPASYTTLESPRSSPLQQVPQLTATLTGLTCSDKNLYNYVVHNNGIKPFLRIVEQPQNHFRFRYVSEMVGTHGCILGKSCANNSKAKTHPTVELANYNGRALIRCQLAQHNNSEEHPHKLLEDEQDRDVSYVVPEQGSYKVGFPGMGIIHTAKKDVPNLLFKKFSGKNPPVNPKELRAHCDNLAKCINLNIVRLKFSAHDVDTGQEICEPVFSDPIHNMKSAATNDLKISRISMFSGRPRGGEDVFILVEKVNKKNIMIRFFELDENGERVWSDTASFLQSDVHHQYAIVFRTPKYQDPQTPVNVKVFIELVRPSDGRTSEPQPFLYRAEEVYKNIKKRKNTSSYSSIDSSSGGSITNELPLTVLFNASPSNVKEETEIPTFNIQLPLQATSPAAECGLGSALGTTLSQAMPSPMWSGGSAGGIAAPALPQLQLDSAELNTMARDMPMEEHQTQQAYLAEYFNTFSSGLSDLPEINSMDFIRTTLVADSGRVKVERSPSPQPSSSSAAEAGKKPGARAGTNSEIRTTAVLEARGSAGADSMSVDAAGDSADYPAFYTPADAAEVKKLVRELCETFRDKKGSKNDSVRTKLERLFDIRLSNGDTFLHMTLCSNQPSFETIVKVIHSVKMSHLLNYGNNRGETVLHLAVIHSTPELVSLLVSRGCDPAARNCDDETAVHYAVRYAGAATLRALLDAAERAGAPLDLDAVSAERQSALHLCALHGRASCAALLGARGASGGVRDAAGRTPLHLCAYDVRVDVARALLPHAAPHVHATDGGGRTPLAVACARAPSPPALDLVRALLAAGARAEHAWRAARDHPAATDLLRPHMPAHLLEPNGDVKVEPDDDVKSEPEDADEYESADDDPEPEPAACAGLAGLGAYAREVSRRVEAAGAWRELARRLRADALLSWFQNEPSPAYTLLYHVKECRDDLTSKSLALILDDMGLGDAANVIRSHIE